MRGIQVIGLGTAGVGDFQIDPATNKMAITPPPHAFRSDNSMNTSPQRKLDLLCPPVATKLLEIHMIILYANGGTSNSLGFRFHIVNFTTGSIATSIPTTPPVVNPVSMTVGMWTRIFDVTHNAAPTILPGHYLQMEFTGYAGAAGAGNNYSFQPYWRLMAAS